ncbi:UPF0692 protein CG33108 isoform X2 [Drosophila erecta]|uniref:UPF0692 protein CG33108 isoform X2 n=1 Tax=Drosophila erecta TaxID=7220 RepID=UPI0007329144|nr:UPF0692 protein CG33108 isoform X2 [Drosophila erecta]KQS52413.1 uncharacterized protein Dere_GG26683 [Drosophila erecta]
MSNFSPVTPPPPPPPMIATPGTPATTKERPVANNITTDKCIWACEYPELQKGCYMCRVCEHTPPKHCQYYSVNSIIQVGPTCGLVALSMLLGGSPTAAELLKDAIDQEYTLNGELFSAQYMLELSRKHMPGPAACQLHAGPLDCKEVKELLKAGGCLLVPYDADVNHAPCVVYGHRAHWALIVGYLEDPFDRFYVLARHGKSRNLAVWPLDTLSKSNENLIKFAQPKGYPDVEFMLPPGGIGGSLGLNERCILVNGMPNEVIHVRCS